MNFISGRSVKIRLFMCIGSLLVSTLLILGVIISQSTFWVVVTVLFSLVILSGLIWFSFYPLHIHIQELSSTLLAAESDNDISARVTITGTGELSKIGHAINSLLGRFEDTLTIVGQYTGELHGRANDLIEISQRSLEGVEHQQSQTELMSSAVTQMSTSVQEVAQSAATASSSAQQADKEIGISMSVQQDTLHSFQILAQEVNDASAVIKELDNICGSVGSVVDVIRGITDQTNLLALNAAIEAARAGESGRGFAVVADEVRTLAQRTQESTTHIQETMAKLQTRAKHAVEVMTSGAEKAGISMAHAEKAGQSLETVKQTITTIADLNFQIAAAAEQQATVSKEIHINVETISHAASENADGARKTAESAQNMSSDVHQLQGLMSEITTAS